MSIFYICMDVVCVFRKVGKSEKESIIKEAIDSAKIWQMRFDTAEKSRLEYRESTRKLVSENDRLHDTVNQVWAEANPSVL